MVGSSGLIWPGGLATTAQRFSDKQQWDFPNAWAPLQDMMIEGLEMIPGAAGKHNY
jgi:alpha,alpha-trehalase